MRKRRPIELFSISLLDILSGALGAVIILYVAIPKNLPVELPKIDEEKEQIKRELSQSLQKIKELTKSLNEEKEKQAAIVNPQEKTVGEMDADIGFNFKGKNIVFLIDTSFSMTQEQRMIQVKAGLKMLLSSLPRDYKVDIVQFPLGMRSPYRAMWGGVKEFQGFSRLDTFEFIYSLKPSGGTPTKDVLLYVLRNYQEISDIVLLTDGVPTLHNKNKKDDIYEILRLVRENNFKKIQINTIGVGSDFLSDKTTDHYKFLSLLSSENNGFFVGF